MGKGEEVCSWGIYLFMGKGKKGMYKGNLLFCYYIIMLFDAHFNLTVLLLHPCIMCLLKLNATLSKKGE